MPLISDELPNLILPYNEAPITLDGILREPRIIPAADSEAPLRGSQGFQDTGTVTDLMTKEEFKPKGILPPDDLRICSLYVSHMNLDILEGDIK
jgi:pre-mRNA-splicing factor RBM22/SLT11